VNRGGLASCICDPNLVPHFQSERCTILIKAAPHSGPKHGETVCCAGVTPDGVWRRLYPVPFRRLAKAQRFSRWDWVSYQAQQPKDDRRPESRRIREDSIEVGDPLSTSARSRFLEPILVPSWRWAHNQGQSLALIRPTAGSFKLYWKRKTGARLARETRGAHNNVSQMSMLDVPLKPLESCPFEFRASFADAEGEWDRQCGDWEIEATYWRFRQRLGSEEAALAEMSEIFNGRYNRDGLAVAMGNQARSPATWTLLGIIRLNQSDQLSLI
jgi:hypothetical protein